MPAEILVTALKRQKIFILNGDEYFGTVKAAAADGVPGYNITEAIPVEGKTITEVMKTWCAARNIDDLQSFGVTGGNNSLTIKELSEKQVVIAEAVAANVNLALKYALKEVENKAIMKS